MFFPVRKITILLVIVVIGLMAVYTFNTLSIHFLAEPLPEDFIRLFHLDQESNLPSWYSSFLLTCVALASGLILTLVRRQSIPAPSGKTFWLIFMLAYLALSLDESAMVHEHLPVHVKWVYIYAPLAAPFFLYCVWYWWKQRAVNPRSGLWIIGGLLCFGIGGGLLEWITYIGAVPYALRQIEYVMEEGMEMIGTIAVLTGCLLEANRLFSEDQFRL